MLQQLAPCHRETGDILAGRIQHCSCAFQNSPLAPEGQGSCSVFPQHWQHRFLAPLLTLEQQLFGRSIGQDTTELYQNAERPEPWQQVCFNNNILHGFVAMNDCAENRELHDKVTLHPDALPT